jgi:heme oxygenase
VRYLGDLAGGQMMLRIVARDYPEATIGGRRFYDFGPAAGHGALAAALRASLDALPPALADAIVAEAQSAFERHVALFDELATS